MILQSYIASALWPKVSWIDRMAFVLQNEVWIMHRLGATTISLLSCVSSWSKNPFFKHLFSDYSISSLPCLVFLFTGIGQDLNGLQEKQPWLCLHSHSSGSWNLNDIIKFGLSTSLIESNRVYSLKCCAALKPLLVFDIWFSSSIQRLLYDNSRQIF